MSCLDELFTKMACVEEFEVTEINQVVIKGPMKWIVLIFGAKHNVSDLKVLM